MIKKNKDKIRDSLRAVILLGVFFLLLMTAWICSNMISETNRGLQSSRRATWTPVAHPTDLPYQVEGETLSYFGDMPAVVIFGSQDPDDDSPLQAINISTDDVYDVTDIPPAPGSDWSRPVMAENKDLYFQVGDKLYVLSPGGGMDMVDLPYDARDPAFCNWSWKGHLVCVNQSLTGGFLVDQALNVTEIPPSVDAGAEAAEYYPPFRVGENTLRVLRANAGREDGDLVVYFRDLDLASLTITEQQARFDFDFNRSMELDLGGRYGSGPQLYTQTNEIPDVLGMTDDEEVVYLQSRLEATSDEGRTFGYYPVEIYNKQVEEPTVLDVPINFTYLEKHFYQNHLITDWFYFSQERKTLFSGVYDLETGDLIFDSADKIGDSREFAIILPFGENWLVVGDYGLGYVSQEGLLLKTIYFLDISYETMSDGGYYTVSQPMEP
jgi:hypothetical protein